MSNLKTLSFQLSNYKLETAVDLYAFEGQVLLSRDCKTQCKKTYKYNTFHN